MNTQTRIAKIKQAKEETMSVLIKATSYKHEHQDHKLVNEMYAHIEKLDSMLAEAN